VRLLAALRRRGATVACAESLTGGHLADLLSATPGSSDVFVGGVVSYATSLKQELLGVPAATVRDHGVVSAACAEQMAAGVKQLTGADYAVSTTGVAGPASQEGRPVGLVYVGLAGPDGARAVELRLGGGRAEIREGASRGAVSALLTVVLERDVGAGGYGGLTKGVPPEFHPDR
jgi:nicotinamide-nucleotide amidase